MNEIPDAWPPPEDLPPRSEVPLFPLPNVWLFPGIVLPLHIFEPRYRSMIEDSLDGPGRIALGTLAPAQEQSGEEPPATYPIGGLGEIGNHQRLDDGRFNIHLVGLARVRMREIETETPYRMVEVEPIKDLPVVEKEVSELRAELVHAVLERLDQPGPLPEQVQLGQLADLLTLRLSLPHAEVNALFSEIDPVARARAVLAHHERQPPTPEE